jgi:hypothetical protein
MSIDEIDEILLANISHRWRKMAYVIGVTMGQIERDARAGLSDLFFAERIASLVREQLVEYQGDLNQIRECEIRRSED